jgi:hypothetical protein
MTETPTLDTTDLTDGPDTAEPAVTEPLVRGNPLVAGVLAVVVFAVNMASPSGMTADSDRAVSVAASMVHFHSIALNRFQPLPSPGYAITISHGQIYPLFPWAVSLFAVPWVIFDDVLHHLGLGEGSIALVRSGHDWSLQVEAMATVVAACTVVVYFIALRGLRLRTAARCRRWALGVALAFAFTTPVWSTASRSMWQHGPSMLCLAVGILCALRAQAGQRGWMGMGAALAASYAMRPTDSVVIIVIFVWMAVAQRRHLLAAVIGGIPPLAIFLTVNLVAYRQPLSPYYTGGQGFDVSRTMGVALAGNLISPSRGLLIFCPIVVLAGVGVYLRWRNGELTAFWKALAIIPVLHWIVISAFKHWWGGDSFGPRFFTDMMPIFVALALPAVEVVAGRLAPATPGRPAAPYRFRRALVVFTVVALVWGFVVNAQGAVLRSAFCWNSVPIAVDTHPSRLWQWNDAQFDRGLRVLIWGPDRGSEFIRDGVDLYGCPDEPVRP